MAVGWLSVLVFEWGRYTSGGEVDVDGGAIISDVAMVLGVAVLLYVAGVSLRVAFPRTTRGRAGAGAAAAWERRRRAIVGGRYGSVGPSYEELLQLEEDIGVVERGFTKEQIGVFPTIEYKESGKEEASGSQCAICLEELEEGDVLRVLPCGCKFRRSCIDRWLATSTRCPLCRAGFA